MVQWGSFTNSRKGNPDWDEPDVVGFGDYRNYIRLRPNPGFRVGRFHWCNALGRGKH